MKKSGFKIEGQRYVRVVNKQLFQYVEFQGSSGGEQFTVNIGIDCLFDKEIVNGKCSFESMRLGMIFGKGDIWWYYTDDSAKEVAHIITDFLLPILDDCSTYSRVYQIIEKHINYIPDTDKGKDDFALELYLSKRYNPLIMLCIKLEEYDNALVCLNNYINQTKALMENHSAYLEKMIEETPSPQYKEKWIQMKAECITDGQNKLQKLNILKDKILKKDCSDVIDMMNETETKNLDNLKKYLYETN